MIHDVFDFDTYERNPMEFYVVATDVETGEAVYHKLEDRHDHGFEWIRASASMPLVSQIVEIDGGKYLDGALADSIPVQFFESIGYDRNIVILTRPLGYQKKRDTLFPLMKLYYRKYPKLVEAMASRHTKYRATLDYILSREQAGELFVIRPPEKLPIGRTENDPKKLHKVYEIGRQTAESRITEIQKFLSK